MIFMFEYSSNIPTGDNSTFDMNWSKPKLFATLWNEMCLDQLLSLHYNTICGSITIKCINITHVSLISNMDAPLNVRQYYNKKRVSKGWCPENGWQKKLNKCACCSCNAFYILHELQLERRNNIGCYSSTRTTQNISTVWIHSHYTCLPLYYITNNNNNINNK